MANVQSSDFLSVPMCLDALCVNDAVLATNTFRRWRFSYTGLPSFKSPEPLPFSMESGETKQGVYLHWTLPRTLRSGKEENESLSFPLVPNRWLITRRTKSAITAWVLESDCPLGKGDKTVPVDYTSPFLVDSSVVGMWKKCTTGFRNAPDISADSTGVAYYVNLGIPFALKDWRENAAEVMFLTAVAPSNAEFSMYFMNNSNIFSFYDNLQGIDKDTVSYHVTGWYSDISKDILNVTTSSVMKACSLLGWSANTEQADRSFYTGYAFCIPWDRHGGELPNDELTSIASSRKISVAIGRSTAEAQSALIGNRLSGSGYKDAERVTAMLRMFRYGLLDELDTPGGDLLVEESALESGFSARPGGIYWEIIPRDPEREEGLAEFTLTVKERALLVELRARQREYEECERLLKDLQRKLHDAWWKRGHATGIIPKSKANEYKEALVPLFDRNNPDSLLSKTIAQIKKVKELSGYLPENSDDEYTYQKNIEEYGKKHGVEPGNKLHATPGARFWLADDPVVAINGIETPREPDLKTVLPVRGGKSIIQKFCYAGNEVTPKSVFDGNLVFQYQNALPEGVVRLFGEYLMLDPLSAEAIASKLKINVNAILNAITQREKSTYPGELPYMGLDVWQKQPWQPRYLEWKIKYFRTSHDGKNWIFNGAEYLLSPNAKTDANGFVFGGISTLSAHETDVFRAMLEKYVHEQYAGALLDLEKWMEAIDGWRFLTQRLTGLKKMLAQRDIRVFRAANAELTEAGDPEDAPFLNNGEALPSKTFTGLCDGQFYFTDLIVYDKFGRALNLTRAPVQSGAGGLYANVNFPLIRARTFIPNVIQNPELLKVQSPVQLNLNILQHTMLDIQFADHKNDLRLSGEDREIQPICGWLISNHIGHSILLFTPDGRSAGELKLVQTASQGKRIHWVPLADDSIGSLEVMRDDAPHLYRFVTELLLHTPDAFTVLIDTIDSTLWTFQALGTARNPDDSPMAGRALALVRAGFRLLLDGPAILGSGMEDAFNEKASPIIDHSFDLRLGNPIRRNDSLIGYFEDTNGVPSYDRFHSVIDPQGGDAYVCRIGSPRGEQKDYISLRPLGDRAYVTLLLDPVLSFHAAMGILPVKEARLPRAYWKDILPKLALSFRMGPLLTRFQFVQEEEVIERCIRLNTEIEKGREWLWKEPQIRDGGAIAWEQFPITPASSEAYFSNEQLSLREGILQMNKNLSVE